MRRRNLILVALPTALLCALLGPGFGALEAAGASTLAPATAVTCATDGGVAYFSFDSGGAPTMNRCATSAIFGVTETPFTTAQLDGVVDELGAKLGTVSVYSAWGSCAAGESPCPVNVFNPSYTADQIANAGAVPVISWESWNSTCTTETCEASYANANIAPGGIADPDAPGPFDAGITAYAEAVAAYGGPLYIRFDPEMDADQLPWETIGMDGTEGDPNADGISNTPDSYVALWEHVRDIFLANGADNVTWIWSPSVALGTGAEATETADYPGNSNVGMIGIDGYDWGARGCGGNCVWITASGLFSKSIGYLNDLTGGTKPIWIAETAAPEPVAADGDVTKAGWIAQLGADFALHSWSNVVGFSWYNYAPSTKKGEFFAFDCMTNAPPHECNGLKGNAPPDPLALTAMALLVDAWQTPT